MQVVVLYPCTTRWCHVLSACSSFPCEHGGSCEDTSSGGFTCACAEQYKCCLSDYDFTSVCACAERCFRRDNDLTDTSQDLLKTFHSPLPLSTVFPIFGKDSCKNLLSTSSLVLYVLRRVFFMFARSICFRGNNNPQAITLDKRKLKENREIQYILY